MNQKKFFQFNPKPSEKDLAFREELPEGHPFSDEVQFAKAENVDLRLKHAATAQALGFDIETGKRTFPADSQRSAPVLNDPTYGSVHPPQSAIDMSVDQAGADYPETVRDGRTNAMRYAQNGPVFDDLYGVRERPDDNEPVNLYGFLRQDRVNAHQDKLVRGQYLEEPSPERRKSMVPPPHIQRSIDHAERLPALTSQARKNYLSGLAANVKPRGGPLFPSVQEALPGAYETAIEIATDARNAYNGPKGGLLGDSDYRGKDIGVAVSIVTAYDGSQWIDISHANILSAEGIRPDFGWSNKDSIRSREIIFTAIAARPKNSQAGQSAKEWENARHLDAAARVHALAADNRGHPVMVITDHEIRLYKPER